MQVIEVKTILWAEDMERAVTFWRDTVGLDARMTSPYWSELLHGDAVIALHGGGDGSPRESGLGLSVADIAEACRAARDGGATIRRQPEARPGEPILLAELMDPDGNIFQMSQFVGQHDGS